jgi:uncharacterized damage-inducible protein DinB
MNEQSLASQILETWEQHHHTMLFLLEHLPAEALGKTLSTKGGRTIAKQLAHLHQVRIAHLEAFAKKQGWEMMRFEKEEEPTKEQLAMALEQSGEAITKFFEFSLHEKEGKALGFKNGVISMLGFLISHEAHHRGHLLLTAKQSGIKLPEELKWKLWEWEKM